MAETAARSVAVVLKADVQDYVSKMGVASKATKDFAAQAGRTAGSAAKSTKDLGTAAAQSSTGLDSATKSTKAFGDQTRKTQEDVEKTKKSTQDAGAAASQLGVGMAAAGLALAAGIGVAVKAFADFDQQMSNVRAVSGATADEMAKLTDAALKAGAATKFSASDAAAAEAELAKAGISTNDILGGALTGALNLAAAGNLDLANAATVSANAMNIFSLKGEDVSHIADVLAAGANKSAADVDQLGQAMQQSGLVAAQMGLSLEDTVGVLSAFADNGLKGSDAGTSLKTMLQRLVPSSKEASEAMKDIGFSAYDASGNLKSIDVVAGDLQKGLAGLTQKQKDATLATIFGSDAVRGANVLFKLGARGVRDYTTAVNDQGAATRVAAVQMDNFAGDLENLRGSIETALIKGGSGANDALRGIAQAATNAVNAFAGLPDSVQRSVLALAGVSAAALTMGGALIAAVPKIVATREALDALAVSAPRAAGALRLVGGAAATLTALTIVGPQVQKMWDSVAGANDDATKSLEAYLKAGEDAKDVTSIMRFGFRDLSGALDEVFNTSMLHNAKAFFSELGTGFGIFGGTSTDDAIAFFEQMDKALTGLVKSGNSTEAAAVFKRIAAAAQTSGVSLQKLQEVLPGYTSSVDAAAIATGKYADATGEVGTEASTTTGQVRPLSAEIKAQKEAAEDASKAYDELKDSVKNYGAEVAGALAASAGFEESVDNAAQVAKNRAEAQAALAKFDADAAAERNRLQEELKKASSPEDKSRIQNQLAQVGDASQRQRLVENIQRYAKTLDLSTEAGRTNTRMLLNMAEAAKDSVVANNDNGLSIGELQGQMEKARGTFIRQAQDFGATKDQAETLANQLGLTADNVDKLANKPPANITVDAKTEEADKKISGVQSKLDAMDRAVVEPRISARDAEIQARVSGVQAKLDAMDRMQVDPVLAARDTATQIIDEAQGKLNIFGQTTATATLKVNAEMVGLTPAGLQALDEGFGFKGFASGGYTGDAPKHQPVGVVHGGEYVFTKEETAKAGVVNLRALARSLRGYDRGGYVTPQFADRGMVSSAVSNTYGGSVSNDNRAFIDKVYGLTLDQVQRDTDRRSRLHALGRRGAK